MKLGQVMIAAVLLTAGCQGVAVRESALRSIYCAPEGIVPLDGRPSSILHHGGRLYVTSFHDSVLWVVDATSGRELQRFDNFDHYTITVNETNKAASASLMLRPTSERKWPILKVAVGLVR